ncbi:MAG TPA: alpha-amylase family glycosyl hydrolase [Actinomycetes bacterium]
MSGWPSAPVVYEIDTWPWLQQLSERRGAPVTLEDVTAQEWDDTVPPGIDAVWLMGVWERSPAGLAIARANDELQQSFHAALPDLEDGDIVGSPYCVRRYVADERLGGPRGLAAARAELARRGLKLVLDYVPNHVAPDNPAVTERPEIFVQGTRDDLAAAPASWLEVGGRVLAHGRDPYFPAWPDVVQLDAFSPAMRDATGDVLRAIGEQCDGVRCDMAMLLTNDVFGKTWGAYVGAPPAEEFWPAVIGRVRSRHPDLVLIAEAYWEMEWTLQQQGFDFCYDKRLYDRLVDGDADGVRLHLTAGLDYQRRLVRFIENHDEPRAASVFPPGKDRAAAVVVATLPGATLWHDGELTGRRVHLPVFLGRRPVEDVDHELLEFHQRLLSAVGGAGLRDGDWSLLECGGWPDNPSYGGLVAWAWHEGVPHHVVVVNLSGHPAQGRVPMPWAPLRGRYWRLHDLVADDTFDRDGDELVAPGLYVDLPAWGFHVLAVEPEPRAS